MNSLLFFDQFAFAFDCSATKPHIRDLYGAFTNTWLSVHFVCFCQTDYAQIRIWSNGMRMQKLFWWCIRIRTHEPNRPLPCAGPAPLGMFSVAEASLIVVTSSFRSRPSTPFETCLPFCSRLCWATKPQPRSKDRLHASLDGADVGGPLSLYSLVL